MSFNLNEFMFVIYDMINVCYIHGSSIREIIYSMKLSLVFVNMSITVLNKVVSNVVKCRVVGYCKHIVRKLSWNALFIQLYFVAKMNDL